MIPGAQKFFKRQPSEYERDLQNKTQELSLKIFTLENSITLMHQSFTEKLDELRREMMGYIKPEAEKEEEAVPVGFQTFTQRRGAALANASKSPVRKMAEKTKEVLKQEQANG